MSYSDYGGYAWKNGVRYTPAEDGTVTGVVAPQEQPLKDATGLKLDVLIHAANAQGYDPAGKEDETDKERRWWNLEHPHHVVFGGVRGIALVGHKQSVTILHNGEEIQTFPLDDYAEIDEVRNGPQEITGVLSGFSWAIRQVTYPHSSGCLLYLRTPDGVEYSGCCGYGIGDHWWKENDGREFLKTGDRHDMLGWVWDSFAQEEDCKRLGVKPGTVIGYKDEAPWPTYEDWEKRVREWVATLPLAIRGGANGV